jgi:hypothetical protein
LYPEIRAFSPLPDGNIYVEFVSGESGIFDMNPYMKSSFFSELHDYKYFCSAHLEFGVITWPNGQDISPATIRLEMIPSEKPAGIILRVANSQKMA